MTANDDKQKQGDFRRFVRQTIFAGLALVLVYNVTRPKGGPETGQPAPTFAAETIEGKRFSIEEQEGRVVVLDFWATWCPPCRKTLPALQAMHERYKGDDGVMIASVSIDEGRNVGSFLRNFMKQKRYSFPVISDSYRNISAVYDVKTVPTMVVIDPKGRVANVQTGLVTPSVEGLIEHIEDAIKTARNL